VSALRDKVDIIVVAFHWGEEKSTEPKAYQRTLARAAVESGADLVIGHHPHVVQGIEVVDGIPVFYSLGNAVFGSYSKTARWGLIARVEFDQSRPVSAQAIPVNVFNEQVRFQPVLFDAELATEKLHELKTLSAAWGTEIRLREDGVGAIALSQKQ